jgi:RNA:NAD 2'-phosphotransferase (TPT1/KptA family)
MEPFKGIFGYHVTMSRSVHRIVRNGLVPIRGPRSRLLGESRDAVYLFRDRDAVDYAVGGWLGDALPDVPLTLLRVTVPANATLLPTNADYEIVVADRIPPDSITNLGTV